jgi:hypothetical protein
MFIELHKPDSSAITINLDKLEYFVPADNGKHAIISIPNYSWLCIKESYEQVKELIIECQKK